MTAVGLAVGLAVGAVAVGYETDVADLAIMGAISGAFLGIGQGVLLRGRFSLWIAWMVVMPVLWSAAWVATLPSSGTMSTSNSSSSGRRGHRLRVPVRTSLGRGDATVREEGIRVTEVVGRGAEPAPLPYLWQARMVASLRLSRAFFMSVEVAAGVSLIVAPLWFNTTFALLGKRFDIRHLARPATEILDRFRAGGLR